MKKNVIIIFICIVLMTNVIPVGDSFKNSSINSTIKYTPSTNIALNWTEIQKLRSPDVTEWDNFGISIALDSHTAFVGASLDDDNGYDSGSVYVFTRTGATWTLQQKLLASDGEAGDLFGYSISLDGDHALIGAYGDDGPEGWGYGSSYVFKRNGTIWVEEGKLFASDSNFMDLFGYSVSLSSDTALIGAWHDDDNGDYSGSAYVFTRTGATWTLQQKLLASDGEAGDSFGYSISLDGDYALIGAYGDESYCGSAYVFNRTGTTWTQQQKLLVSDSGGYHFGNSLSLSDDTALIGAVLDHGNTQFSGAAYVFTRSGTTWTKMQKLIASDGKIVDCFGTAVSLCGNTALIGANQDADNGYWSGSAYIFTYTGNSWTEQQKLLASDGTANDSFGQSVCLSGNTAFITAIGDVDTSNLSGSVYIFQSSNQSNQPPEHPTINGLSNGKAGKEYEYKFLATDPENDQIYYIIDWGDNTSELTLGPYASGYQTGVMHSWNNEGTYTIRAKTRDAFSAESYWGTLTVTMPCSYKPIPQFFELLFQRFPNAFPLLRQLIGY